MIPIGFMVIHNFIRKHNNGDLDFEHAECDENYEPTIPERYNKYVVPSDGSSPVPNAPTMDLFLKVGCSMSSRSLRLDM
jgi:hypothetical protein